MLFHANSPLNHSAYKEQNKQDISNLCTKIVLFPLVQICQQSLQHTASVGNNIHFESTFLHNKLADRMKNNGAVVNKTAEL